MERSATSRDNPWIQTLWLFGLLGTVAGGVTLWIGNRMLVDAQEEDPSISLILIAAGGALLTASLVALALGFAVSAYLWERKNPE